MNKILLLACVALTACAPVLTASAPQPLSETDLRRHVFAFADDSMLGRRAGSDGGLKASRYLADHLARAGLEPGGNDGTFYQSVPLVRIRTEAASSLTVAGQTLAQGADFLLVPPRWRSADIGDARVVFLGTTATDTSGWPSRAALRGRVVLFDRTGESTAVAGTAPGQYLAQAAAILVATELDRAPANTRNPGTTLAGASLPAGMPVEPATIYVTPRVAALALGRPLAGASSGTEGATASVRIVKSEEPLPTFNVIAILRGSDPVLRNEYVAIGAHPDHVGTRSPLDHDSLRAVLWEAERRGWERDRRLTATERAQIHVRTDTLARSGPRRADSVFNGADDDASGSMAVLALAESFARSGVRPRRSLLFIWNHAEESGLLGSRHFADHPTVPREAIVSYINLDMVGRGGAADKPAGGPRYVQVVGSRRLSTELGNITEAVNARLAEPMEFDYSMDAEGHPERIYCRSDHANFARYGIPVVFFSTGLHADYHQLTDEPQYVNYPKLRRVGELAGALLLELANAERRPVVDGRLSDPFAPCTQ